MKGENKKNCALEKNGADFFTAVEIFGLREKGCQMVYFPTKKLNVDIF
jgi:hypothetical protein